MTICNGWDHLECSIFTYLSDLLKMDWLLWSGTTSQISFSLNLSLISFFNRLWTHLQDIQFQHNQSFIVQSWIEKSHQNWKEQWKVIKMIKQDWKWIKIITESVFTKKKSVKSSLLVHKDVQPSLSTTTKWICFMPKDI